MSMSTRLRHVCNTLFGLHQYKYCATYDVLLSRILDEGVPEKCGDYTIRFSLEGGHYNIWVANKFYAYGHLYLGGAGPCVRPKYKTMMRLYELERRLMS